MNELYKDFINVDCCLSFDHLKVRPCPPQLAKSEDVDKRRLEVYPMSTVFIQKIAFLIRRFFHFYPLN